MSEVPSTIRLHRMAVSTVCVALVTLTFGALTTSMNAGMAFRDWPTSDGQNMLTYPWLSDFARDWDKFLEHGHRLAGALIGMWSIGLVVLAFLWDTRRWIRGLAITILVGVICQGILGGFRVQLNERGLAMLHGLFAAIVFSLMGTMCVATNRNWSDGSPDLKTESWTTIKFLSLGSVLLLFAQYMLGGLIRHRGTGLHEHLGLGFVALLMIVATATACLFTQSLWLKRSALVLMVATFGQVALGLTAWVLKFGFAPLAYVAIADSIQQVGMRTLHTVWGIVVFMAAVVHCLKVFRVAAVSPRVEAAPIQIRSTASPFAGGGA